MNNTQDACMNLSQFERNKYFYGKLMTVRDFETEQSYFNEKGHLLSRLIHGTGLVCGLEVKEPEVDNGKLTLKLTPGVAIDCCGREIVVGEESNGKELEAQGTVVSGTNYIYLEYEECEKEPVPVPVNASTCEETCCYNRTKEIFEVVVSQNPPEIPEVSPDVLTDAGGGLEKKKFAHDYFNQHLKDCPSCETPRVLLAVITVTGDGAVEVDETKTLRYRALVYNNPMLYELISSHLIDFDNPHKVTAEQTGALKSVEGLSNPGGNIDIDQKNAITINTDKPEGADPKIIIGETHSEKKNNPHAVTAEQTGALKSVEELSNPGGNIDIDRENAITIRTETPANADPMIIIGENHSTDKTNPHGVTATQVGALVSVDGVKNPGGGVDLVAGKDIKITPGKPETTSITIASTAGAGVTPATTVTSVGKDKEVGESKKYARENHVHDLADTIVEFRKLATTLQGQLNTVFQYLRERALKCTVINFREVGDRFFGDVPAAFELSNFAKKAVDVNSYETDEAFTEAMSEIYSLEKEVAEGIKNLATEESFKGFNISLEYLGEVIELREEPLKVATAQDEVCFYALLLEPVEHPYR